MNWSPQSWKPGHKQKGTSTGAAYFQMSDAVTAPGVQPKIMHAFLHRASSASSWTVHGEYGSLASYFYSN